MSEENEAVEKIDANDMFDRPIRIGDLCAYPVRRGAKMWMNKICVQKITHDLKGNPKISGVKGNGYSVSVTSLDRVVLVGRDNTVPFME